MRIGKKMKTAMLALAYFTAFLWLYVWLIQFFTLISALYVTVALFLVLLALVSVLLAWFSTNRDLVWPGMHRKGPERGSHQVIRCHSIEEMLEQMDPDASTIHVILEDQEGAA